MPTKQELLDLQFIEIRHKLIEVGAFLDRIERHEGEADYRLKAMEDALPLLQQSGAGRAEAILNALEENDVPSALLKAGLFGAGIVLVCIREGYGVRVSSREVPQAATRAVVRSMAIVLVLNSAISIFMG